MNCKDCFNCKRLIKIRNKKLKGVKYGSTMFDPKTPQQGLIKVFCTKGMWVDHNGDEKVFKTLRDMDFKGDYFKEFDNCQHYEGEGDKYENAPLVKEINYNIKILRERLTRG